ncbi:MAG: hypothetical protein ACI84R_003885 [Candidatus Azotimanducaceae bacterium]|jgi:hypothetical protein
MLTSPYIALGSNEKDSLWSRNVGLPIDAP